MTAYQVPLPNSPNPSSPYYSQQDSQEEDLVYGGNSPIPSFAGSEFENGGGGGGIELGQLDENMEQLFDMNM